MLVRRICVELKKPFFEVMKWPVSEIAMWAAHFGLEHEEYEKAKAKFESGGEDKIVELSNEDSPIELQVNAIMAVF